MASTRILRLAYLLSLLIAGLATAQTPSPAPSPSPEAAPSPEGADDAELVGLLETYFKAKDLRTRREAQGKIAGYPEVTFDRVADALPKVKLWDQHPSGVEKVEVRMPHPGRGGSPTAVVQVRVPAHYDPGHAYPLLLGIPDRGRDAEQFTGLLAMLASERRDRMIVAAVEGLEGVWFSDGQAAANDPLNLLDVLKRRYHLDTNRILLTGYGAGAHAAFSLGLLDPDAFAAVMPLAGACALETGAESADLFLPNLTNTPVFAVFGAEDLEKFHPEPGATVLGGVAGWNRYMAARAEHLDVPLRAFELPDANTDGIVPDADVLTRFLDARRPAAPHQVALRFRYPEQGRIGWLRQTRFTGDPWTAQSIVISPGEKETPEEAIRAVLTEKLAFLGGSVAGQAVRIDTGRCDRIDVLLSDGLVDLGEDVTIHVDGTQR